MKLPHVFSNIAFVRVGSMAVGTGVSNFEMNPVQMVHHVILCAEFPGALGTVDGP